jgi:hypothetical protein
VGKKKLESNVVWKAPFDCRLYQEESKMIREPQYKLEFRSHHGAYGIAASYKLKWLEQYS